MIAEGIVSVVLILFYENKKTIDQQMFIGNNNKYRLINKNSISTIIKMVMKQIIMYVLACARFYLRFQRTINLCSRPLISQHK